MRKKTERKILDYHAKLIIYDLRVMSIRQRCRMAEWLENMAADVREGGNYADRFIAKFMK